MTRYVAFLRAINVGGHTVKMDHLRGLFESLSFANVETFIASGNVIFETKDKDGAKLEKKIASHLEADLGYGVDTFVRTIQETAEIERRCPFQPKKNDDLVYVAFLHETLNAAGKSALTAAKNKMNDFAVIGREIYWLRLNRDDSLFLKSSLEKIVKAPVTVRIMTSIHKLVGKYK
ncbi:MAG TPA: DUF1697 domain-containing protein [Anaerolineales bacterium]|nr:DUF1697 domain-containing protein [Anaerolineales bacterium]